MNREVDEPVAAAEYLFMNRRPLCSAWRAWRELQTVVCWSFFSALTVSVCSCFQWSLSFFV